MQNGEIYARSRMPPGRRVNVVVAACNLFDKCGEAHVELLALPQDGCMKDGECFEFPMFHEYDYEFKFRGGNRVVGSIVGHVKAFDPFSETFHFKNMNFKDDYEMTDDGDIKVIGKDKPGLY